MLCIHLENSDPHYCLAAEEYLLKNFTDDVFILWQSEKAVIVGKHQNLLAEINYPFALQSNIALCRRISGGGTVFHDAGNVNFSFIKNVKTPAEISFAVFTSPIVEALAKLGVTATTSGRNDLLIEGLKISGNAEHVNKNRVLHHGTLLFDSDLKNLGQAIKVVPGKYESKAVQSNRSPVANISRYLKTKMTTVEFIQFLLDFQFENTENQLYILNENDTQRIEKLATEKFRTWEWNFGYSPKYTFRNEIEIEGKLLKIELLVEHGMIVQAEIKGNYFSKIQTESIQKCLSQKKHHFDDISNVFPDDENQIIYSFFG